MHLSNAERIVRLGEVSELPANNKMNGNGNSKQQQNGTHSNDFKQENGKTTKPNRTHVLVPEYRTLNEVLNTVLTAWTILIQRYQRDTFHHFSWKTGDIANETAQCISTAELDLSSQKTTGGLSAKLSNTRSNGCTIKQGSTIVLNDGTQAEVCKTSSECLVTTNT
jgi:hypothetical protein